MADGKAELVKRYAHNLLAQSYAELAQRLACLSVWSFGVGPR